MEAPAQTQLYTVPTGEGYFPNQSVFEMLASIHAALTSSAAGTSVQDPAFAHPTAHRSRSPPWIQKRWRKLQPGQKKRQRVKEDERVYKQVKKFYTCHACGQPKLKKTGHRGFKGYSYCPKLGHSYGAFLGDVKKKINEKKSK